MRGKLNEEEMARRLELAENKCLRCDEFGVYGSEACIGCAIFIKKEHLRRELEHIVNYKERKNG